MTVRTSLHLTSDGAAAADVRRWMETMVSDGHGVFRSTDLAVTERGAGANMSVDVAAGQCVIIGDEASTQGGYFLDNDATLNVAITAADPTNPRKDLIVAKIQDSDYSGATDAGSIVVVDGTPAGSPAEPAVPSNAIVLAMVDVAAAASSIVDANITDRRTATSGQRVLGGWQAWDTTGGLKAGGTAVTHTITYGKYRYLDDETVMAQCFLSVTGAQSGTVTLDLPVTAVASDGANIGTMYYYIAASTTHVAGVAAVTTSGAAIELNENNVTTGAGFAITPSASADEVVVNVVYEV